MISDNEKARMREIEATIGDVSFKVGEEDPSSEERSNAVGVQLATYDAWFAVREGTEWRGMSDPKKIARQVLRDIGIGE